MTIQNKFAWDFRQATYASVTSPIEDQIGKRDSISESCRWLEKLVTFSLGQTQPGKVQDADQ